MRGPDGFVSRDLEALGGGGLLRPSDRGEKCPPLRQDATWTTDVVRESRGSGRVHRRHATPDREERRPRKALMPARCRVAVSAHGRDGNRPFPLLSQPAHVDRPGGPVARKSRFGQNPRTCQGGVDSSRPVSPRWDKGPNVISGEDTVPGGQERPRHHRPRDHCAPVETWVRSPEEAESSQRPVGDGTTTATVVGAGDVARAEGTRGRQPGAGTSGLRNVARRANRRALSNVAPGGRLANLEGSRRSRRTTHRPSDRCGEDGTPWVTRRDHRRTARC